MKICLNEAAPFIEESAKSGNIKLANERNDFGWPRSWKGTGW